MGKRELARQLGCSVRFIEYRLSPKTDGGDVLPSRLYLGRREMRRSEAERYLRKHGFLVEEEGA